MTAQDAEGILYSRLLDRRGGARPVDPSAVGTVTSEEGVLWIHLDVKSGESWDWLRNSSGLDETTLDALLAGETRPRYVPGKRGMLIVLRGVNTNPGADPEDMVSIRLWVEQDRIISTRRRKLLTIVDIRESLEAGNGPRSSGEFLTTLVSGLADRIGNFVETIEDDLGGAESKLEGSHVPPEAGSAVATLRREIASVRRFLAPQRDALDRLYRNPPDILTKDETEELREEADRITRYLEDLDLARERAMVLREEYLAQIAQQQNARMYVLSIVAAIFLPLSFLTGLLGMNVGGLPGLESPRGFMISVILMVISAAALLGYFRFRKWL